MVGTDRRPTLWLASCIAGRGDDGRPLMLAGRSAGQTPVWASNDLGRRSSKDSEGTMLLRTDLATAATVGCGGTPPSSWRLGALLSSDDFGSSVELGAHGQVLWRAQMRAVL
jgi:hypothetical protein